MFPLAAASIGIGGLEALGGLYGLSQIGQAPLPSITPGLQNSYNTSLANAKQGYSPQEAAAFQSKLAGQTAANFRNATDQSGGQLAGAINRSLTGANLGAQSQFAANDAALQRQNQKYSDSLAQTIQQQQNAIDSARMQHYNQLQQAYGGAVKAGLGGIGSALNFNQMANYFNKNGTGNNGMYGFSSNPNADPMNPQIPGGVI